MRYIITLIILIIIGLGGYWFMQGGSSFTATPDENTDTQVDTQPAGDTDDKEASEETPAVETIGTSVEGRNITAHHFGDGQNEVLFVAGIHGGYEWNTTLLAYEFIDYLRANPDTVPDGVRVTVIPTLNPDGLFATVGTSTRFSAADVPPLEETIPGRFNANGVDLNRNFACQWQTTGMWQRRQVDAGSEAFSEPESKALREYVRGADLTSPVVWYSASGDVVPAGCNGDGQQQARALARTYANASGYTARDAFDYYEITGDAANWMAKEGIPTISVVLETHSQTEWERNRDGIRALLEQVRQQ